MESLSAFDILMNELGRSADVPALLAESMTFDPKKVRKIPLRFRIIAYGFVRKLSLEQLNAKLTEQGCEKLYARSLYEASLIYCFLNGASYPEWTRLVSAAEQYMRDLELESPYFSGRNISFSELERYVLENSDPARQSLATARLTEQIQSRLIEAVNGKTDFEVFLWENVRSFSPVREKARYYFCKYLYYNLKQRIESYVSLSETGRGSDEAFLLLQPFKGINELKRKKMTPEQIRAYLRSSDLSCGGIFDAFNERFFEYVSLDWIDILTEAFGSLDRLPENDRKRIAKSMRVQNPKQYGSLSDEQIIASLQREAVLREAALDESYSLTGSGRGYQKNRAGENAVRSFIKGSLDIDRTTLICFLLFFGMDTELSGADQIHAERIDSILSACGFPVLRPEDDFDCFVLGYLDADDPGEYLMEEVTNRALEKENFYLYRVYNLSASNEKEFQKLTERKP